MKADIYLLLRLMKMKWQKHNKNNVTKYVYNFLGFCYIYTDIALSDSSITQDEQTYYGVLARYMYDQIYWYDSSFYVVD